MPCSQCSEHSACGEDEGEMGAVGVQRDLLEAEEVLPAWQVLRDREVHLVDVCSSPRA